MTTEETKHIQDVLLMIIKDVDAFCKRNNIVYYLLGGSALGAVRHKGFIPWDDDLDIILQDSEYRRFIKLFKEQMVGEKYQLQVGKEDWPLNFSKIRLVDTSLIEQDGDDYDYQYKGIFLDVFKFDNVKSIGLGGKWQYFSAKVLLAYAMSQRKYTNASFIKKLMMLCSFPLKVKLLRKFFEYQVEKYNDITTDYCGAYYLRTRYNSAVLPRSIYGKPAYIKFEDTELPVPEKVHEYLISFYGDYMKLPPEEKRVGSHISYIDFGKY